MNKAKTLSRRHLLVAAMIGLTPISMALWLTYPSESTEMRGEKATGVNTTAPAPKNTAAY